MPSKPKHRFGFRLERHPPPRGGRWIQGQRSHPWVQALLLTFLSLGTDRLTCGYTVKSPEVRATVEKAMAFLESPAADETRNGGKVLIGLAFLKNGAPASHPRVEAARAAAVAEFPPNAYAERLSADVYTTGLSIVFLVTLEPTAGGSTSGSVRKALEYLRFRQKEHGGWGYIDRPAGDNSMTQYAVLASWEAAQVGYEIPLQSIESVLLWLSRVQDPSGGFPYHGKIAPGPTLIQQEMVRPGVTMAGLGATYICADLLGMSALAREREERGLPPALKEVRSGRGNRIEPRQIKEVLARGQQWIAKHYTRPDRVELWVYYYLYALERYGSFREAVEGIKDPEPKWYNEGVDFLRRMQKPDGSWTSIAPVDKPGMETSFAVLFLLRSSQRSIQKARDYGAGTLVGGRGLPNDAAQLTVRDGRVITKPLLGPAEQMLGAIDALDLAEGHEGLDELAELPLEETRALVSRHQEKLRQLAGGATPEARMAALRTLAKTRNLDHVPLLISALRDPDPRVAVTADDGLRWLSRQLGGEKLSQNPSEGERKQAVDRWKAWLLAVRPDAQFED